MKELKKDIVIDPVIQIDQHHKINTLRIEIDHQKDGHSLFTGEFHKKGIICRVTPMDKSEYGCGTMYDGKLEHQGFYVYCLPCERKAPKKMEKIADAILPLSEIIKEKFLNNEFRNIAILITNTVKELQF
jgi:hypothetical protein